MPRSYSVTFTDIAVSAVQDLFEINAATGKPVALTGLFLSQSSDFGDAQAELRTIQITRGATTSGSGGAAVTAQPLDPGDAAFGGTCERNNTTQASAGTPDVIHSDAWNVQAPYAWQPTPEQYIWLGSAERAVLEIPVAPTDALTVSGTMTFIEYG